MENFKFIIMYKILADRLSQITPTLISLYKKGLIQGRDIKDYIYLASKATDISHSKYFGGNLAMKIDVTKDFDTLDCSFLIKVMIGFGFKEKFCNWIGAILKSISLSISFNGKLRGYFKFKRGVM